MSGARDECKELTRPNGYACECGGKTFGVTRAIRGTYYETFEISVKGEIEVIEGCTDKLNCYSQPKTMLCEDCGKRQKNILT